MVSRAKKKIKVLSLFDGISCARVALERAGFDVEIYFASEIDEKAIKISKKNYPSNYHIGDVQKIKKGSFTNGQIDLLIGGSPCQDLSIAKHGRKGLKGSRSSLFYEYVRILKEVKPTWFILENVASMSKEDRDTISEEMGVQPIMIDAALVSGQMRKRLFWTNIPNITLPKDRKILLKDILLPKTYTFQDKSYPLTASYNGAVLWNSILKCQRSMVFTKPIRVGHFGKGGQAQRVYSIGGKSVTLSSNGGGQGAKTGLYKLGKYARKLDPIECERLQGLPDRYTDAGIGNDARRSALGNAFNVDVIAHIMSFIPKKK